MSIPKITGRQARDLLRGTTPGPWEPEFEVGIYPALRLDADDEIDWMCAADRDLAAAAPALAETVAWLYGREPDLRSGPAARWDLGDGFFAIRIGEMVSLGDDEKHIVMTLNEAEDAARSLLRAIEEARP